jgi:diguanylate cyclase (GGDEF)-like protein
LSRVLDHVGQLSTPASLVALHLVNGEDIRLGHGRRAADLALSHVCRVMAEVLHPTDKIGGLGGYDFGVILLVADLDTALEKAGTLTAAIGEHPFPWQEEKIPLTAVAGVSVIEDGAALETVMANAERNLDDGEKRLKT